MNGTGPATGRAGRGTVGVIGLGLMGGSVVRALAALAEPPRLLGSSPDRADREDARLAGVDVRDDPHEVAAEADLLVYAAPLGPMLAMIPAHAAVVRPHAAITDVAGLKAPVLARARSAGLADRFVGAHPMAGGEGSGFRGGRAGLFSGATVWLCADPAVDRAAVGRVERFWADLGGCPEWTDAGAHDRLMERVSHLPQLVSNALALALEEAGVAVGELGPGGRDMTRLAASSPAMWRDLLAHVGPEVATLLREVARWSGVLADRLDGGDAEAVAELMTRTRRWRAGGGEEARR